MEILFTVPGFSVRIFFWTMLIILVLWLRGLIAGKTQDRLPPGAMGWPVIGDNLRWYFCFSRSDPRSFVAERQRRYGDFFKCSVFGNRAVVSLDPNFNRFILQNEGRLVKAKYPKSLRDLTGKYTLISVHGDLQRKLHGMAVSMMNPDKLENYFFKDIQDLLQSTLSTWNGRSIYLESECKKLVTTLMVKQLLGFPPGKLLNDIAKLFTDFVDALISVPVRIPGSTYDKGMKARALLMEIILNKLEERRTKPSTLKNDFLSKLLTETDLDDNTMADFLLILLFAGHETSAKAMALAVKFISESPEALRQLREEHLTLKTSKFDGELAWEDYTSMKFTQCIINETLRLVNLLPAFFRETMEDIEVKGYTIPKGWTILAFSSSIHLDENYYPAAHKFNPWRWQEKINSKNNDPLYVPFGGGARLCPGSELAKLEVSLFLHYFVTMFRWEQLKVDRITYFPTTRTVNGLYLKLMEAKHTIE